MSVFIISGIIGSSIPFIFAFYMSTWVGNPFHETWFLLVLGAILVGSLSGYLGFKLHERRKSPKAFAKVSFNFLSAIIGFFLPIVLALIIVPLLNLFIY